MEEKKPEWSGSIHRAFVAGTQKASNLIKRK